jgi:transcriptional regulator with XRE-family HTH domain
MKIGEKIRYLRTVEGTLRGLDRELTQQAVVDAIEREHGVKLSQSYLSQIESGRRPHLTNTTRSTLARFFNVHPGYLVDDPDGFREELTSEVRALEESVDHWLLSGAERFRNDPVVYDALVKLANHPDTRRMLSVMTAVLDTPDLAERLLQVLRPELTELTLVPPVAVGSSESARGRFPRLRTRRKKEEEESERS